MSPATGTSFVLGSCEKFQLSLGTSYGTKFEKENKHGETQSHNFRAYHSFVNAWDTNEMEKKADKTK